jgi:hypothetical protein
LPTSEQPSQPSELKATLAYERPRRVIRRAIRRAITALALIILAASWPLTQFIGLSCKQIAAWTWRSTDVSLGLSLSWNGSGASVAAEVWRKRWTFGEDGYRGSLGTSQPKRLHFPFSRLSTIPARSTVSAEQLGPINYLPHSQVSALGMQILWHRERSPHVDIWTHARAAFARDAAEVIFPSWFIALISLTSAAILLRRLPQWLHAKWEYKRVTV